MIVALGQVGPPVRELWINVARSLSAGGHDVYFLGPSPAFEALLDREGLAEATVPFELAGRESVPEADRREDVVAFNREVLGQDRADLEHRCYNAREHYERLDVDVAVFWNDVDVEHLVARDAGVQTVFLENGYLPETLQIDTEGVNRNATFAEDTHEDVLDAAPLWEPTRDVGTRVESVDPLGLPAQLRALARTRGRRGNFWWTIRDELRKRVSGLRSRFVDPADSSLPERYVFVPLQVHDDTQILYNSPYVDDMPGFVSLVVDAVRDVDETMSVVVKEHPADVGRVEYSDVREAYPDVTWLRDFPIDEVVGGAEAVVTVNSSVGFQAMAEYVPVVTVGDSFYDGNPFVEHPRSPEAVPDAVDAALSMDVDEAAVDRYVEAFRENYFVTGGLGSISPATLEQVGSAVLNVADQAAGDGRVADGAVADDAVADDAVTDDAVADDAVADDS